MVRNSGEGAVTEYVAFIVAAAGHPKPPVEVTVWLMNRTSAGVPPVNEPAMVPPLPKEQVTGVPRKVHEYEITGATRDIVPLLPVVHITLPAVGRPVTVQTVPHPAGFTLVHPLNVRPRRSTASLVTADPPALVVVMSAVLAVHASVGLKIPPDVVIAMFVAVFRSIRRVVSLGSGDAHGLAEVPHSTVAEAVPAPAKATRARTAVAARLNSLK